MSTASGANCKVMAICNQKGGTGKTTTTCSLGFGLARKGKKVLLIDLDPQGNLTSSMGIEEPDELDISLVTLLEKVINNKPIQHGEGILHHVENLDFIPGNIELSGLEDSLERVLAREKILGLYIDSIKEDYDYILVDCMPSLGKLTFNALYCANTVLIPVQAAYLPVKGLEQLMVTIANAKRWINPNLVFLKHAYQNLCVLKKLLRQERVFMPMMEKERLQSPTLL